MRDTGHSVVVRWDGLVEHILSCALQWEYGIDVAPCTRGFEHSSTMK